MPSSNEGQPETGGRGGLQPLPTPETPIDPNVCSVTVSQVADTVGRSKTAVRKKADRLDPGRVWRVFKGDGSQRTEYYHPKLASALTEAFRQSPQGIKAALQQTPVIDNGTTLTSMAEGYEAEISRLKEALARAEAERDLAYEERTKAYAERDRAFADRADAMGQVAAARERAAALQAALQGARERELRGFHLPGTRRRIEATYAGLLPAPDMSRD